LRQPSGVTLAVSLAILCLSFRGVKGNLDGLASAEFGAPQHSNLELSLRYERDEKINPASLTSKRDSLSGKYQPSEADTHRG
jgi:hypothetical protein